MSTLADSCSNQTTVFSAVSSSFLAKPAALAEFPRALLLRPDWLAAAASAVSFWSTLNLSLSKKIYVEDSDVFKT